MKTLGTICLALLATRLSAAEVSVELSNAPSSGYIHFQVYDSADKFGDFRDPVFTARKPAQGDGTYRLSEVTEGDVALLVFHDENGNGVLDRNFIGIPREPIGLSNRYRPKGPPSFDAAKVTVQPGDTNRLPVSLNLLLGKRGQWGLGAGAIGQSSPYEDSDDSVLQVIPAITYISERIQWFGPNLRVGIAGSDRVRLAFEANYRIGAYDEDDSPVLEGLGNRRNTLLGGLALQIELPRGIDLGARYQHDVLDNIGGGTAGVSLSRDFQRGRFRLTPQVELNWLGEDLSNHDFGVAPEDANDARVSYEPGDTFRVNLGLSSLIEVSTNWQLIINLQAGFLEDDISDSPIVSEDVLVSGFAALTYQF